jgi:DNA invertase Pin-like site-specific DNA recombinase
MVMPTGVNLDRFRKRKVVFYGRVSTEHEQQIDALGNQLLWYDDLATRNTNWDVLRKYIDKGITGTQAKKRPSFLEMIEDAKAGLFDLIVTREVCRFARNVVDCLQVTRELKNIGVEVYFVSDNIWTMDNDGELRLSIMATLAQDESRKVSERVRAGQKTSRDNGVLYGNGNILGYDRVGKTYVINPEQAETVRMIYDLYERGLGMTAIRDEMIRRHRKDKSGQVRWDNTKISRCLHNSTYKGYMGYLKSQRNNYLDQKIIINHDESTYMYVKGTYEPIISVEQWERCRQIREARRHIVTAKFGSKMYQHCTGIHTGKDIWTNKLKCRCGCSMRKNKWRKNKSGEIVYGYKCYNQLNRGSGNVRIESGLIDDKSCNLRELCDWKLEMMARDIFQQVWGDTEHILDLVHSSSKAVVRSDYAKEESEKNLLLKELEKLNEKIKRLNIMRLEESLSHAEYQDLKIDFEHQRAELQTKIEEIDEKIMLRRDETLTESVDIRKLLSEKMDFEKMIVDRDILNMFVSRIIPLSETEFSWYLNFDLVDKSIDEKKYLFDFKIDFAEAKAYKEARDGMLRRNQWEDIKVTVYA